MRRKERICGENRNSYLKRIKEMNTAMVLKEDYYSKLSSRFSCWI